jgi:hypothetical protein
MPLGPTRVRAKPAISFILRCDGHTVQTYNPSGYADDGGPIRDIARDHRISSNPDVGTDAHSADYFCSGSYIDVIAKNRALMPLGAQSNAVEDDKVSAGTNAGINYDADAVHNDEAGRDIRISADRGVRYQTVQPIHHGSEHLKTVGLEKTHHAVHDLGRAAVIEQHSQQRAASRWQIVDDSLLPEVCE